MCWMNESVFFPFDKQFELQIAIGIESPFPHGTFHKILPILTYFRVYVDSEKKEIENKTL